MDAHPPELPAVPDNRAADPAPAPVPPAPPASSEPPRGVADATAPDLRDAGDIRAQNDATPLDATPAPAAAEASGPAAPGPDTGDTRDTGARPAAAAEEEVARPSAPLAEGTDGAAVLTLDRAAAYAGRSPATLRRAVRQGRIPRRYQPGLYGPELVFDRADLDAWLAALAHRVEDQAAHPGAADVGAGAPSQALTPAPAAVQLYALVAAAYAQRLAALEAMAQQQGQQLTEQGGQLAELRQRLATLEERPVTLPDPASTPPAPSASPRPPATPASRPRPRTLLARLFGRRP